MAHTGELMESLEITGDMVRPVHKYSIENDINKLFDTIDIQNAYKALRHSEKNLKDGISKSAMKRPMKVKSGHIPGIGFSESVSLKQALRGLCISHASEMAAMKKQLSKATPFSSRISNAGSVKSLYRAVMFNASANDGGMYKKRSNVNVSKDKSVPLSSIVCRDGLYARAEMEKSFKLRNASTGSSSNTKLPVLDENVCDSDDVPCSSQEGKSTVSDLTFVNNEGNNPRVFRTNNIVNNRLGLDSTSPSVGFSCCYSGDAHCTSSCWSSDSPETSSSRTICVDSVANKSIYRHKMNDRSRSRRKGKMSFSSKNSIGDNRSSVSSSEESIISGSSCKSYKPHMSKDLRWKAIEYIEQKQGSLGLKHFKLLKKIGGGDIGNIYLSVLIGTNCVFALKVMDIDLLASRRKLTRAQTEKEILEMLDHPFLPLLYAHFTTKKFSCLVMEFCPGGDLHVLHQKQLTHTLSEQATRFYIAEVVLALEYLHMLGVVYRDLKPENVLVREDGHIMLTDFDLSLKSAVNLTILKTEDEHPKPRLSRPSLHVSCIDPFCLHTSLSISCFNAKFVSVSAKTRNPKFEAATLPQLIVEPIDARSNSFVGTHEYLAPEIIKGEGHGSAVDWWTLGILLYEFLYGKTPFKARNDDEDTLTNIVSDTLKFPETPDVSSNARDLIRCLLKKEPQQRLGFEKGAAEIKLHPFFQGMNWALIRCETPPHVPKSYDMETCNLGISRYNIENERRLGDYTIEEDIVLEMF